MSLLFASNIHATEVEKCPKREVLKYGTLKPPLVTELKEGSISVSAVVGKDGKVSSVKILSRTGDSRWGTQALRAMKKTLFKPANISCEFEYKYSVKFDG